MFFDVRELEVRAGRFDVELGLGEVQFLDPKLRQTGPLRASGKVELVSAALEEIRVSGHISVPMEADCDRCLEPAACSIDSDFELTYAPLAATPVGEEVELDPSEAEIGFYEGDGIELIDVLREYILLALPMQRVCSPDCKGICPVCGQSRNQKECVCHTDAVDDRWESLKKLVSE
jgi:uncharacterized protein